jgi:transcriptional regulator with XRE-family HTH domain
MTRRIRGTKAMGIRLERLLDERNLRAAHLAEELDVGRDYVSRWLKGGGMTEGNLDSLAEFFDTTPAWISTGTGPMHPDFRGPGEGDVPSVDRLLPDDPADDEAHRGRR